MTAMNELLGIGFSFGCNFRCIKTSLKLVTENSGRIWFRVKFFVTALLLGSLCVFVLSGCGSSDPEIDTLIHQLRDEDWKVRAEAAIKLGKKGSKAEAAVPFLAEALLKDEHGTVRGQALAAIESIGPAAKKAVPALAQVLKTESIPRISMAASALKKIGLAATPALVGAAQHEDRQVRLEVEYPLKQTNPISVLVGAFLYRAFGLEMFDLGVWLIWFVSVALIYTSFNILFKKRTGQAGIYQSITSKWPKVQKGIHLMAGLALLYGLFAWSLALRFCFEFYILSTPFGAGVFMGAGFLFLATLYLLRRTSPASKWAKISVGLFTFLCLEVLIVGLLELLTPGGHPSLGTLVYILAEPLNIFIMPLSILLFLVSWFAGGKRSYVVLGLFYSSFLIGVHPIVNPNVYSDYIFKTFAPIEKRLVAADPQVRIAALAELKSLDIKSKSELTVHFIQVLQRTNSMEIRRFVYGTFPDLRPALGEVGVPLLVRALQDEDKEIRLRAALALQSIGPDAEAAVPVLIQALEEPNQEVRNFSAYALKEIGPAATPAVLEALKSESKYSRIGAATALNGKDSKAKEAVPLLIQMTKDPDTEIGNAAVVAMGHLEPPVKEAVDVLIQIAKENAEQGYAYSNAIIALGRVGPATPEVIPTLVELLRGENKLIAKRALEALQMMSVPEAKEAVDRYKSQGASRR